VRILSISGATNGFSYSGTALPLTVAASLAPGGAQPFSLTFSRTGGTSLAAFSFTMTVEVNGGPPATVTINVP